MATLDEANEAKLTMYMRVISVFMQNEEIWKDNAELKTEVEKLKSGTQHIIDQLTEEEKNRVLERYKQEMEYLGLHS